jgi:uncharacterized membrane protein
VSQEHTEEVARLETHLGRLLLGGVIFSAVLLAAGLLLTFVGLQGALPLRLMTYGLFVLMATPILRVVLSVVEYIRMRDWFFVITTAAVLAVLFVTVAVAYVRLRG